MGDHKSNPANKQRGNTIELAGKTSPVLCGAVCSNMFKQCGGACMKKRGHLGPHSCYHCHYRWDLSIEELSQALIPRQGT